MDALWERNIPLYKVQMKEIEEVFSLFNSSILVKNFEPISIGCRNSNYVVHTNKKSYLLRISPLFTNPYENEIVTNQILHNLVSIPLLHHFVTLNERWFLIYEYIPSTSLQLKFQNDNQLATVYMEQIAKQAALIHSTSFLNIKNHEFPPFLNWFSQFLQNENVKLRLGLDICSRISRLAIEKTNELLLIDTHKSLVHGDFRPGNMIVDNNNSIYIVDWEFVSYGHTLADIGQLFRYRHIFTDAQLELFASIYNKWSITPLPDDWFSLSKLRDTFNLLQMLGNCKDLPKKYNDLTNLVLDTLDYFGY